MSNLFATTVTATTTFQNLGTLLGNAGLSISSDSVTSFVSYLKNNSTTINLYVGTGSTAPTTNYATITPLSRLEIVEGINVNQVWIASASSTVATDFVDGGVSYTAPSITGVIGTITLTNNVLSKGSSNNLVDSSVTDDGTTVTATEPIVTAHATTPYFETASGKTNTGYVNIKGKTSGAMKFLPADASGQTITTTNLAQTVGAGTITIPDLAGASVVPTYNTLTQTLTNKTLTAPVVNGATSASGNFDLSGSNGTFKTTTGANTLSGATTALGQITSAAGTTSIAPFVYTSGTNLTSATAGATEYDGANFYQTIDTTSGRGAVPVQNYQRLTANGSTISTIANFFGATSNISLVASAFYEIEITAYFLKTTAGTVVWTLTNSAAPTAQNIYYEMSPITGVVAPPGTATMLVGQIVNDATATLALTATGTLTTAVNHYMRMKIWLQNGTGTSLKIQATASAGSITPLVGSYYTARRLPAAAIGTFAA